MASAAAATEEKDTFSEEMKKQISRKVELTLSKHTLKKKKTQAAKRDTKMLYLNIIIQKHRRHRHCQMSQAYFTTVYEPLSIEIQC